MDEPTKKEEPSVERNPPARPHPRRGGQVISARRGTNGHDGQRLGEEFATRSSRDEQIAAISIWQPWASLIVEGRKTIELRNWTTRHRGPLLICAGVKVDPLGAAFEPGATGVAVGIVDVLDVRLATPQDAEAACVEAPGYRYAWLLGRPRRIKSFPVTGQMGLFRVTMP